MFYVEMCNDGTDAIARQRSAFRKESRPFYTRYVTGVICCFPAAADARRRRPATFRSRGVP